MAKKMDVRNRNTTRIYQAGNYLRLSVDSDYTGSDSLENQRAIAKEYIKQFPDLVIAKEYMDDGKTGTNFERPAFSRMIADIKQGVINCVIVKDLSRFGRQYIEAGNYIEKVFPFLDVRFISIVDRYDSNDPGCDQELLIISLKNLMHEMYARDISKKVKSTFQMKQENGLFYRSSIVPYGYKMEQNNGNYCIDAQAAAIVKEIYTQYNRGISRYSIARWLYKNCVLTPAQYYKAGRVYQTDGEPLKAWQSSTIVRLLTNPVYIGNIIRHKTEQSFFDGRKTKIVPEADQIVIVHHHPPIINEEMFENIQKKLAAIKERYKKYRQNSASNKTELLFETNVFQGKLFCGDCNSGMTRTVSYRKVNGELQRYKVFKCRTHVDIPARCDTKCIKEMVLCEIFYKTIQKHISLLIGSTQLINKDVKYSFKEKLQNIKKEKQHIQNQQIVLAQDYIKAYTQYTSGELSAADFQNFRISYADKNNALLRQANAKCVEEKFKKSPTSTKNMVVDGLTFDNAKALTTSIIEACVERINIFAGNRVEIKFLYQDCLTILETTLQK